ncbi:hypothetical protein LJR296_002949 [Cupriavidus necator]|uniref:hypothetical protein n=1 Tax=Cupriavidus necator TaxID=106590 RepID=UPI003ECD6040
MSSHSDADDLGFRAAEIFSFLESHGLKLNRQGSGDAPLTINEPTLPDWTRPYIGRRQIPLGDAAEILADLGPVPLPSNMGWTAESKAKIKSWRNALIDAIGAGEIEASDWFSTDRDNDQMLAHADIRAWCKRKGQPWPIPELNPQPAMNTASQAEIDRLRQELEGARSVLDAVEAERDAWKSKAECVPDTSPLIDRIAQLGAELASAQAEIERIKEIAPPRPVRLMAAAIAAQIRHWGDNCDLEDSDTWTSQANVLEWIESTFPELSEAQRKAVEIVACPVDRSRSPKRRP